MTLATLFDFPQEDRRLLTYWSDMFTNAPGHGPPKAGRTSWRRPTPASTISRGFGTRGVNAEPTGDLISMLAHGAATRDMAPAEYHGNVVLLIIGGNDTTRNTISGSVYALNKKP